MSKPDSETLDPSFDYVPSAVEGEIEDAVRRALGAGAEPPLSYAGAGAYGIVICDSQGVAYKVARHGPRGVAAKSLKEEEAWFRFANEIPSIRSHVADVYGFDERRGVLIRECVTSIDSRHDWSGKRAKRRLELYDRIARMMRKYGFRDPEFKEDSFVYHPRRGPVLVDAGLGARDIGWANARRARELIAGAQPKDDFEPSNVIHGLRMDAGCELPAELAERLAAELQSVYPAENPVWKPEFTEQQAKTLRGLENNDPDGFMEWAEDLYQDDEETLKENLDDPMYRLDMISDWASERCGISVSDAGLVEFDTLWSDDECDVREVIGSLPVVVYHHTASGALKGIRDRGGLVPATSLGYAATEHDSGRYVFVTTRLSGPEINGYIHRAQRRFGGEPVTLTIASNLYELEPDPDDEDLSTGRTQFVLDSVPIGDIVEVSPERYAALLET